MTSNLMRAALACAAFAVVSIAASTADAGTKPSQGTSVGIDHDPQGIVARGTTDENGTVVFSNLKPGHYTLVIDGPSLVAAMDKPAPEKKESHSSFSIGIGGMFGGGSSRGGSHQDTKGGPAYGHPNNASHSSSGGGGFGLGVSIPIGGSDDTGKPGEPGVAVSILMPAVQKPPRGGYFKIPASNSPGDIRMGFDVEQGGDVTVQINALDDVNNVISEVGTARLTTDPNAGKGGQPSRAEDVNNVLAEVSTTRLKAAPDSGKDGQQNAPIQTSRSNIKHAVTDAGGNAPNGPSGPSDAPIQTSRSNIKHAVADAGGNAPKGQTRTWVSGVGDDANPVKNETRTWISGVGDDANPCSRTAPCMTVGAGVPVSVRNGLGNVVGRKLTDAKGNVAFRQLPSGDCVVVIRKTDLDAAVAKTTSGRPATVVLRVAQNGRQIALKEVRVPVDQGSEIRVPFKVKEPAKRGGDVSMNVQMLGRIFNDPADAAN